MADVLGGFKGSLAVSVIIIGAMIAASTGIVGQSYSHGAYFFPNMLQRNYDQSLATGTICATGLWGPKIPPLLL
ncbi:MAG: hypothetical protein Ct9H300mP20_00140 [Gammaproteobacteria bacterium]|nr:MAG: hypothetical protein Ct9H300mP20_00140 [Gammaproteobacteria bacterium]